MVYNPRAVLQDPNHRDLAWSMYHLIDLGDLKALISLPFPVHWTSWSPSAGQVLNRGLTSPRLTCGPVLPSSSPWCISGLWEHLGSVVICRVSCMGRSAGRGAGMTIIPDFWGGNLSISLRESLSGKTTFTVNPVVLLKAKMGFS